MKRLANAHPTQLNKDAALDSFRTHLEAEQRSESTIRHYLGATLQFLDYCEAEDLPPILEVRRRDVEAWLAHLGESYSPATVRNRHLGVRAFYDWLVAEDEIASSPFGNRGMRRVELPELPQSPKDVVSPEGMRKVFKYLEEHKRWRDAALIAVLYDTGMRTSELAAARMEDMVRDEKGRLTGVLHIPAMRKASTRSATKNKTGRWVRLSPEAMRYLDRYWRRRKHSLDYLIAGQRRPFAREGVYWAVRRCFEEAKVEGTIGGHDLRHTSASHVAVDGLMSETDAMALYGWKDPEMWRAYTSQARQKAALAAHERASPLSRLRG